MKHNFLIYVTFILLISIPISSTNAQQLYKIFDVPGGGSGTTNTSTSSDDSKTTLYVLGGIIVAGIVIYALLRDKKEKPKTDTTAVILDNVFLEKSLAMYEKISNMQSQIPINISIGLQNDLVFREEKRYFVGLNYNF